ncbi:RNA polymerase subunit sigma [Tenacibaculum sp. SZ-18]|uniref:RNA polymerase sigma factor n=1 Tax=Tenacibaculum sp. SZ-18 TaxID=754423 RepID=UPI000C2D3D13|nr:sigma-70 family RNA polymerase sigma factor [Tenacibaculum sp. SZ-18]AUC16187.1 RNA polymerase subunit sigma [Tenacibaculum sp. SZ-18]
MDKSIKDIALQEELRNGNKNSLRKVYVNYRDDFLKYAFTYNLSETDALDIYHDTIIAFNKSFAINKTVLEKSSVKTYLFGIGKNKIYNHFKKSKKIVLVKDQKEDGYDSISIESVEPTMEQIALSKALNKISKSCRTLLQLFYLRNLSIEEILKVTDYKDANTVSSHKSRCMKKLKELVGK